MVLDSFSLMVGSKQPKELAKFYEKIFQKEADMVDGDWRGWALGKSWFTIGSHSEVKEVASDPDRLILNFTAKDVKNEFERIQKIGAKVIKEPYDAGEGMWIATFADPDGNLFQLMSPWEE